MTISVTTLRSSTVLLFSVLIFISGIWIGWVAKGGALHHRGSTSVATRSPLVSIIRISLSGDHLKDLTAANFLAALNRLSRPGDGMLYELDIPGEGNVSGRVISDNELQNPSRTDALEIVVFGKEVRVNNEFETRESAKTRIATYVAAASVVKVQPVVEFYFDPATGLSEFLWWQKVLNSYGDIGVIFLGEK